jgi:NAD(P)H dehydrogenase (quinone)
MSHSNTPTLLVSGASGNLGRRVVQLLLEKKVGRVVAASRDTSKLADLAALGAELRTLDFDASVEEQAKAFAGVERALIVSSDALDRPGRRVEQHQRAIQAAERAGVKHIVYTSFVNPDADSPVAVAVDHRLTEAALEASSLGFTNLRNNLYADLLLESAPSAVASGKLFAAIGDGAIAYVTREDCAQAAAGVLANTKNLAGRVSIDITGPAAITQAELAAILSQISGRSVEYVPLTPEQLKAGMVANGLPAPIADLLVSFDVGAKQGRLAVVSGAVRELAGRAPQSVIEFLTAHRAALTGGR